MEFYAGYTYHVYNQGNNNKVNIFYEEENYLYFLRKMEYHLIPHAEILAWCLMPNHFHWLLKIKEGYKNPEHLDKSDKRIEVLNRSIGTLQSSYTQAINRKYNRSGSLFRTRTKAKQLSEDRDKRSFYGVNCFFYIHQNPLKAGLVKKMEDWPFSSFRDYAGIRGGDLCNKKLANDLFKLPNKPDEFYKTSLQTIPDHVINKLF